MQSPKIFLAVSASVFIAGFLALVLVLAVLAREPAEVLPISHNIVRVSDVLVSRTAVSFYLWNPSEWVYTYDSFRWVLWRYVDSEWLPVPPPNVPMLLWGPPGIGGHGTKRIVIDFPIFFGTLPNGQYKVTNHFNRSWTMYTQPFSVVFVVDDDTPDVLAEAERRSFFYYGVAEAANITPTGMTLHLVNPFTYDFVFTGIFHLSHKMHSRWEPLYYLLDTDALDIVDTVLPANGTLAWPIDWSAWHGRLPAGTYTLFALFQTTQTSVEQATYLGIRFVCEFTITDAATMADSDVPLNPIALPLSPTVVYERITPRDMALTLENMSPWSYRVHAGINGVRFSIISYSTDSGRETRHGYATFSASRIAPGEQLTVSALWTFGTLPPGQYLLHLPLTAWDRDLTPFDTLSRSSQFVHAFEIKD